MPAMVSRGRGGRRTISEINMVPFIDVMLVLLIIFMVTAPPQPGLVRAFALALLAHLLLMIALTWGIRWNRENENAVAEAELWASVPQQAAPKLVEQPPPPPEPQQKVVTPPPPPAPSQAD